MSDKERVEEAVEMGERLAALIKKMRRENQISTENVHDVDVVDELAQVGTILMGLKY